MAKESTKSAAAKRDAVTRTSKEKGKKATFKKMAQTPAKKPKRQVTIPMFEMAEIMNMVSDAKLGGELNAVLTGKGKDKHRHKVVKVDRKGFKKLKTFIKDRPEFKDHPIAKRVADSDDDFDIDFGESSDDDFDIGFGKGRSG
jgi:hypothetical protein